MIPKIIHYCWFGDNKMSKLNLECLQSWKRHLKEYKFILWNEKNVDMQHPFINFAVKHKKWAFVADYVRLLKVYEYGGVYLDTDMFVLKPFDDLLKDTCFFGAQDLKLVNAAIFGAIPKCFFIEKCLEYYDNLELKPAHLNLAIPRVITRIFITKGDYLPIIDEDFLENNYVKIYIPEYFYPMPFVKDKPFDKKYKSYATSNSYAVHLWDGSWHHYSEYELIRRRKYYQGLNLFFKKNKFNRIELSTLIKLASSFKSSIFIK